MNSLKFDNSKQGNPFSWHRENGLKGLAWAVSSMMAALVCAWLAKVYPDYASLYKVLAWPLAIGGCLTLLVSTLMLFTWFVLRNDPDVTK